MKNVKVTSIKEVETAFGQKILIEGEFGEKFYIKGHNVFGWMLDKVIVLDERESFVTDSNNQQKKVKYFVVVGIE